MSVFIILIFGFSSIAFYASSVVSPQEGELKPLTSTVVEGDVDYRLEGAYVNAGFTWVRYYDENMDSDPLFVSYLDSLPQAMSTPNGQAQIIVQKLRQRYLNESRYFIASNQRGQRTLSGPDETSVFNALCEILTVTPLECTISSIFNQNTTGANSTSDTTENATIANTTENTQTNSSF